MSQSPDNSTPPDGWEAGTWDGLERAQLRQWAKIPFWRKVELLEEMQAIAIQLKRSRDKTTAAPTKPI
jgi:hypothetical protein